MTPPVLGTRKAQQNERLVPESEASVPPPGASTEAGRRDTLGAGAIDEGSRPMPMPPDHLKGPDLTMHLPGPYCAMVLADHGAGGEDPGSVAGVGGSRDSSARSG